MEERKQKEIEYYEKKAGEWLNNKSPKEEGDFEGFTPFLLESYNFLREFLKDKFIDKRVLDYGCGNGIHSIFPVKMGAEKVIGIDLSEKSLEIARERTKKEGMENKVEFLRMDCEKMEFPDNSFDIIFDGGTFSSLDLDKVFPELARVLKPSGFLIGIETLGHNPFTNLKRKINKLTKRRTEWAVGHIFKMEDLERAKKYFNKTEAYFFHIISWVAFPLMNLPGGKFLVRLLEKVDGFLISFFPFLKKYSFKIVFIFLEPNR